MDALTEMLASDLADELDLPLTPDDEIDRMADLHRRGMATYVKRAADARKAGKAAVAEMEDERKRLKAKFAADLERIDSEVAAIKAATAESIATANKLAAVSRTALEALQA